MDLGHWSVERECEVKLNVMTLEAHRWLGATWVISATSSVMKHRQAMGLEMVDRMTHKTSCGYARAPGPRANRPAKTLTGRDISTIKFLILGIEAE